MMWDPVFTWFKTDGLHIALIIISAYIAGHVGRFIIDVMIRKFVGQLHTDVHEDDVRKRQDTLILMFHATLKVVVWLVAIFTILRLPSINLDLTPLLASASVMGVALGFGAQSIIKDFISGLFIILENQYRVGDVVDLEGAVGTVEQITIRSTIVRDVDGNVHYIPNGNIMSVINKTMGFSNVNLMFAVQPDTDIDNLTDVINQLGEKLAADPKWKENVLEAPHFANLGSFTDTALEIKIIGKTLPSKQWAVTNELRRRLLKEFKKHHIQLASSPAMFAAGSSAGKKR